MSLPKEFQSILWEYNLTKLHFDDNVVIIRLLTLGDKKLTDGIRLYLQEVLDKKLLVSNY